MRIDAAASDAIRRHAAATYPDECCGALIGTAANRAAPTVLEAYALPNATDEGPRMRFLVRPDDYRAAEARARDTGAALLGFYHSHPDDGARPSRYDLDHAWPNLSYVIVAVDRGQPGEIRSWRLRDDRAAFDEEALNMGNRILIPTPLRPYVDSRDAVEIEGGTVGELLANLTTRYAELRKHLYTDDGRLRSFVNVYVNDDDIRYLEKERTPVREGDTISIVPSVAGGTPETDLRVRTPTVRPEAGGQGSRVEFPSLTNDEVKRYSRHLIMPEVGVDGQRKLKAASVLCIGAGGLGSPAALYLAAAGVGTLGLVDFDVVDFSNLQRQIIHGTPDVGRPKLASARERLQALNPEVKVVTHETTLTSKNALEIFADYDVIVDGTDNFPTRYLVNDACVILRKPNVYGSIFRFEGQASVFAMSDGPCYRCLYPEPPPPGLVPSCAEGGVLGVLPGIIGTIQATEAIKLIVGIGEPLVGRFLIFDALKMRFRELKLRKDPDCPACGVRPTIRELIDYEQFCGIRPQPAPTGATRPEHTVTVEELKAKLDRGEAPFILDVREPNEWQICRIPGATLIPLGELPRRVGELDRGREVVVHCKMGGRSAKAVAFLRQQGFDRASNLEGGILAWIDRVDPSQPKY